MSSREEENGPDPTMGVLAGRGKCGHSHTTGEGHVATEAVTGVEAAMSQECPGWLATHGGGKRKHGADSPSKLPERNSPAHTPIPELSGLQALSMWHLAALGHGYSMRVTAHS